VKTPKKKGGRPPKTERNREILQAFESGEKQVDIAERFGLTQGRVSMIIKANQ
jgi:DNA-binding NarL/FixJ family response regulator